MKPSSLESERAGDDSGGNVVDGPIPGPREGPEAAERRGDVGAELGRDHPGCLVDPGTMVDDLGQPFRERPWNEISFEVEHQMVGDVAARDHIR